MISRRSFGAQGRRSNTAPLAALLWLAAAERAHTTAQGVALAVASGALASGAGYSIWYVALAGLSATRAAVIQLAARS